MQDGEFGFLNIAFKCVLNIYVNKNKRKDKERRRKPPGEKASHSHNLYLIWEDDCWVGE
jgi:hypothetical protein